MSDSDWLLTIPQVAERLGLKPVTIRTWIAKRWIASVRLGARAVRVRESEVRRLIERGTIPARVER